MKFMLLFYLDMQSRSKILVDKNSSLQTFYQDLNFRITNWKCAKPSEISDRKVVLNNSVRQHLTCYHAKITIFSCNFVISANFKIFVTIEK